MVKTVTMKDIADALGLSLSAVSKSLNDYPDISPETKALVQAKAAEMKYKPNLLARNLAKQTSTFVGVVIRDVDSIYGEMYKSLCELARQMNLHLILYDTNNDREVEKRCVQNLIDTMALGIVIVPVSEEVTTLCEMTKDRIPVVFLGGKVTIPSVNYVCSDSEVGTRMALEHLIQLGHKNIAMVCDYKISASRSKKLKVYRQVMRELGEKERIFNGSENGMSNLESGYHLGKQVLASDEDITAVFAVKDMMAIGVMQAIQEAGKRIPEDIAVVGYDGINAAALPMIQLTSVSQPRMEMAEVILNILDRHAEDPSLPAEHYLAQPELIIRGSTDAKTRIGKTKQG